MYSCTLCTHNVNRDCKIILKIVPRKKIFIAVLSVDAKNLNATIKIAKEILCVCKGTIIKYDWGDIKINKIYAKNCRLSINVSQSTKIINTNKFRRNK